MDSEAPTAAQAWREVELTLSVLEGLLDRIDLTALAAAQDRQDALEAQRIVLDMLIGAAPMAVAR